VSDDDPFAELHLPTMPMVGDRITVHLLDAATGERAVLGYVEVTRTGPGPGNDPDSIAYSFTSLRKESE
jgi:hypothetical protein